MTLLSRQGRQVLEALAQPADGRREIWRLVKLLRPSHGSAASTKASLSRTLRRLWQAGYVELEGGWARVTLTEKQAAADAQLARLEAGYEAEYEVVRARHLKGDGTCGFFPFNTAADYLEHQRWTLTRHFGTRHQRHTAASLTPAGRERVSIDAQRLTPIRVRVNRKAITHCQKGVGSNSLPKGVGSDVAVDGNVRADNNLAVAGRGSAPTAAIVGGIGLAVLAVTEPFDAL
jgi:hypothetical protein